MTFRSLPLPKISAPPVLLQGSWASWRNGRLELPYPAILNCLDTLWLCQNSYWKWDLMGFLWDLPSDKLRYLLKMTIEIVDLPIKNGDFPWFFMDFHGFGAAWSCMDSPAPLGHGGWVSKDMSMCLFHKIFGGGFCQWWRPPNGQICQGGVQYNPDRTWSTQFIVV